MDGYVLDQRAAGSRRPVLVVRRPRPIRAVGGPGRLPSRGSHGSGHADFPHPALRITASLPPILSMLAPTPWEMSTRALCRRRGTGAQARAAPATLRV